MPRDWPELFITDGSADASAQTQPGESGERRRGLFKRLRENLSQTRQALGSEIQATLFTTLDEHTWERLEEALIMADVGASTTAAVVETLEREATEDGVSGERLSERLIELLADTARSEHDKIDIRAKP